jgi:hypothetical protein
MKTAIILYFTFVGLMFGGIILTSIIFNYFPTTKIGDWFRRHIISEEEDILPPSDENDF